MFFQIKNSEILFLKMANKESSEFYVQILPLVLDYKLQKKNIAKIRLYYDGEVVLDKIFGISNPKLDGLHQQVEKIAQKKLNLNNKKTEQLIYDALRHQSINPTLEILEILNNLSEKTPKNCAIIISKYKEIILGSVCVFVDPRTTLYNEMVVFLIGIRKSAALMVAQKLEFLDPKNRWGEYKLSKELIPVLENYACTLGAHALSTIPFINMSNILHKHYQFGKTEQNKVKSEYEPPCFSCNFPFENMACKILD